MFRVYLVAVGLLATAAPAAVATPPVGGDGIEARPERARGWVVQRLSDVEGSRSRGDLLPYVARRRGVVKHCYERVLRSDPNVTGALELSLTVSRAGRVTAAEVTKPLQPTLDGCVLTLARRFRFPVLEPEAGDTTLTLEYLLKVIYPEPGPPRDF